jgi:hypothetical protein
MAPPVLTQKEPPPPKPKPAKVLYRGPQELVDEIDAAAKELDLSRNEAMTQLLRFAIEAHKREQAKKSKK